MESAKKKFWGLLVVCALAVLAHLRAVNGDFHFDDFHHIVNNPAIKNFPGYCYFFSHPEAFSVFGKSTLYRPLTLLSFALNYRLSGQDAGGWLIFNVLLHALNAGLVFLLLKKWLLKYRPAFLGGLLFAVMPILSQPVNYLSNRATLLAAGFIMLGLILDGWAKEKYFVLKFFRLLLALLCFWLALFSKEIAAVFPALVLLSDLVWTRLKQDRFRIFANIIYWLNLGIFLLIRFQMFGTLGSQYYPRGFCENARLQSQAVFFYLGKLFFPIHLSVLPELDPVPKYQIFCLLGLLALSLGALVFRRKSPALAFGWLWFVGSLLPSSLMPLNVVASEDRVYLGAPGIILGVVWLLDQGLARRGCLALFAFAIIFVCQLALLEARISVWKNEFSLWRDAIRKSPQVSGAYVMYGDALAQARDLDRASRIYDRALHYDPKNPQALAGRCRQYLISHEPELLKRFAEQYEEFSSHPYQRSEALAYQALAELLMGDVKESEKLAKESLELNPSQAKALYALAATYHLQEDLARAEQFGREALKADADFSNAHELMGLILGKQGRTDEAIPYLERYTLLAPDQAEGWLNLGMAYLQMGRTEDARSALERSLKENKNYALGYYGKALVEWTAGDRAKALEAIEQALKREPDEVRFHFALLGMLVKNLEDNYEGAAWDEKRMLQAAQGEIQWLKTRQEDAREFETRLRRIGK